MRYDVVIGIDEIAAISVLVSSLFRRNAVRVLYFLDFFDDQKMSRIYAPARWIIRRFAARANIIVDTNEHRSELRQKALKANTEYLTLHNCPPHLKLRHDPCEDSIFANLPRHVVRLVYTGSISPSVCLEPLLDAVALLRRQACLLIVGNNENAYGYYLRNYAAKLVASDRCRFVGFVSRSRLSAILAGADIGVALYGSASDVCLNERFCSPNKLYEYMAAGLPVVTSNNPSLVSLVERNGWGFCVQPDNPGAIAEAVEKLLAQPEIRRSFSSKAVELHRKSMNFEIQARPLVNFIMRQ